MRKYYFHISMAHPFDDSEGEELPNDKAASEVAVMTVRDIDSSLDLDRSNRFRSPGKIPRFSELTSVPSALDT
jgi:hypothetical protein